MSSRCCFKMSFNFAAAALYVSGISLCLNDILEGIINLGSAVAISDLKPSSSVKLSGCKSFTIMLIILLVSVTALGLLASSFDFDLIKVVRVGWLVAVDSVDVVHTRFDTSSWNLCRCRLSDEVEPCLYENLLWQMLHVAVSLSFKKNSHTALAILKQQHQ